MEQRNNPMKEQHIRGDIQSIILMVLICGEKTGQEIGKGRNRSFGDVTWAAAVTRDAAAIQMYDSSLNLNFVCDAHLI